MFGPGFQEAKSWLYRAEYAAISIAIVAYLVWRISYHGGVDLLQTIFWAALPDLVSFIPIGMSLKKREWPAWGSNLYNFSHTILAWGSVLVVIGVIFDVVY